MFNMNIQYSAKFTLEISMEEFLESAIPKTTNEKETIKIVENELYHTWCGVTSGDWGGNSLSWKLIFFRELYREGHIQQTEYGKQLYGDFTKLDLLQ